MATRSPGVLATVLHHRGGAEPLRAGCEVSEVRSALGRPSPAVPSCLVVRLASAVAPPCLCKKKIKKKNRESLTLKARRAHLHLRCVSILPRKAAPSLFVALDEVVPFPGASPRGGIATGSQAPDKASGSASKGSTGCQGSGMGAVLG